MRFLIWLVGWATMLEGFVKVITFGKVNPWWSFKLVKFYTAKEFKGRRNNIKLKK